MRIINVKQRSQNGHTFNEIILLIELVFLILLLSGSAEEPDKNHADLTKLTSFSDGSSEKLAEQQTMTIDLPNLPKEAKKLEMVLIKEGSFTMGSSKEELSRTDIEWPLHRVTIAKSFYMGKYEVTQAQWEAVMGRNPSYFREKPNHPVEKVSWRACQKFIRRLNALGQGVFRLPTEAEWEYACRAGTETQFSFGNSAENADKYMWWRGNNKPNETKEVGLKLPNPWGLHDMHGNVLEWCSDSWELPYERGPQIDPKGPPSGPSFFFLFTNRVMRGGGIGSRAQDCSSSWRGREQSLDFHYSLGFRLVREYP